MIRYTQGNLLDAKADALVNTVNTVGVMGKGIALQFKERFLDNCKAYEAACKAGTMTMGRMLVTEPGELDGPRVLINFPTKKHWRHPSKIAYILEGLEDLVRVVHERRIRSIALPPLGCGNGGLEWNEVRPLIEAAFESLPSVEVFVFEPTTAYQNVPKSAGREKLTPARALLVALIRDYWVLGYECSYLEVQKLAYFLQRFIHALGIEDPLRLRFAANRYGPYADTLRHLLDDLDGSYLRCDRRIHDAKPGQPVLVDYGRFSKVREYLESPACAAYLPALKATQRLIDGFETPFLMELLSTVDWLIHAEGVRPDTGTLVRGVTRWKHGDGEAARRKARLFDEKSVKVALERLNQHGGLLMEA